ncbi:hypothetical protein SUGI_0394160 [Cryptomeria japonica]|nr:hypothetical protein SUGI_0394160 [Cryptomeria japonica]
MFPPATPARSLASALPDGNLDLVVIVASGCAGVSWASVVAKGPGSGSTWVSRDLSNASNLHRGGGRGFIHVSCAASINVNKDIDQEIEYNVKVFTEHSSICIFKGIWPSLPELHKWISQHWDPLISGTVHIYPMAKVFFVAKFKNAKNRRKIMCEIFFYEKDNTSLLVKPWHSDFNPLSEKLKKNPVWVWLPYLPIHLWANSLFEEIGDAIGNFIMVDN